MTLTRRLLWPLAILLLVSQPLAAADLFYLGQKIPDIQRPWRSNDYRLLVSALTEIDKTQVNALPRRSGEFTGPIYQRMTSPDNFKPQLNIYAPLELRQNEAREVLFQLKELMRLYFDFKAVQQPYGAEALGLMTYSLRQQAILFTLTTEFWMTLAASEQSNPVRLKGLAETKAAAAMLASSAIDYLDLVKQFDREELVLFSAELAKQMPDLFVHLPQPVRVELLTRVERLSRTHGEADVRHNMAGLLPVLTAIQDDVSRQLATAGPKPASAPKVNLSLPEQAPGTP